MAVKKNNISTRAEYTVTYSGMSGVDFSASQENNRRYRFSYIENMYRDYSGDADNVTESVPGFRKIASVGSRVHSIYTHKDTAGDEYIVFHAGDGIYRFKSDERDILPILSPIITAADRKSRGFVSGTDLYILDGEKIIRVRSDGSAAYVGDDSDAAPYVPTTYINGTEYEQRNLLTDKFKERYTVSAATDFATASDKLSFKILSAEEKTAAVTGISSDTGGALLIPSYTTIGGESYRITEISDSAFYGNTNITALYISETVKRIGKLAFALCSNLMIAALRNGVEVIDNNSFLSCTSLHTVYLGSATKRIGAAAFGNCPKLVTINYASDEASYNKISFEWDLSSYTVNYAVRYAAISIEIPIFSPAVSIEAVTLCGEPIIFTERIADGLVYSVVMTVDNESVLDGKEIEVSGNMDPAKFTKNTVGTNFISEKDSSIEPRNAIFGCTVCESFDGRVFISGNPALPNTVFYTSRDSTGRNNPLYFGILNYFNDGVGSFCVGSMLAAGDSLAVFKLGDDGSGSIYYHIPKETGYDILPKIYPVSYIHSGISAIGDSISFFDDPLFLSKLGCVALDKRTINLERSIAVRSGNVNIKLLSEDLKNSSMAKWCGYLALLAGEHMYLADSRQTFLSDQGTTEYEWYYLTGIGSYTNPRRVYRYSEIAPEGYEVHPTKTDEITDKEVYLALVGNEGVTFVNENGHKYTVYTIGEKCEGVFHPATTLCSADGDLLYFGTECGDICVFNNDKRGVAPDYIKSKADFNEEEYKENFGRKIHPYFYSFDSHAPRYALKTVSDNGGIAYFTKDTVKRSLAAKLKCFGKGNVICEAGTERTGYKEVASLPDACINFAELDFSSLSFANSEYITIPLKERERGWIEKSVGFYSDEYMSPFGLCSLSYRFTVKGKIKN